ncbi:MarR family transcriptional regulator [Planosporangium thailandense]|uniref:MarR family transcriptional regulator n=1 Tax=Planosporangium thailandense TaxID=765197 RepID=A0ABX0Y6Y6_9ACTN|nr:MarR family transcriptional regulator [Planosporangium thailandense]NJC73788.1 MarR family transcriptional regulator [Planosporangium thailandense]
MAETGIDSTDPADPGEVAGLDELDRLDRTQLAISFERVFTLVRRLNPQGDISLTAASTLRTLERHGPYRLSELAATEGVTQPAMTQLVSRLEKAGLAQRCADPADGRVVVVRIADAGRELLLARRAARAEKLYELLSALPPADRAAIVAALPALDRLADLLPS